MSSPGAKRPKQPRWYARPVAVMRRTSSVLEISVRPGSVADSFDLQSFHSTMLPNLQVSVYCALTTFESWISPWIHPSEWLNANVEHIRAIFDGTVDLSGNRYKTITFPATMIFQVCYLTFKFSKSVVSLVPQRLIVYILAYNMRFPTSSETYFFF